MNRWTSTVRCVAIASLVVVACATKAEAQTIAAETDITGGLSTDDARAVAVQGRVFGELSSQWRFLFEAAWASKAGDPTDAFGAAYPYSKRVKAIENYVEGVFHPRAQIVSVKAGRYRTPFGLSSRGDYAYGGFLRAPLIRYDGYFGLSNNFLEHGATVMAGAPSLNAQISLGRPADVGVVQRRDGLDTVVRVQGYAGSLIVGASFSRTLPYQPETFAAGHARFTGIDARFARGGVELRGEWIDGQPFDGTTTKGGYIDLVLHRRAMGPLTFVARAESLNYHAAEPFAASGSRYTIGARVRMPYGLSVQVGAMHQLGNLALGQYRSALDVAATYSVRWQ